jgi:hypothetical protein
VSAIVEVAIAKAGLAPVLAARARGDEAAIRALVPSLEGHDLLVLGALADRIRATEVSDLVRIYADVAAEDGPGVMTLARSASADADTGLGFLRAVAMARITGPTAARIRVNWTDIGLELAQVALGFGASELVGVIASKRGLPIADGTMSGLGKKSEQVLLATLKRRELAGFVRRSGRRPAFVRADGTLDEVDSHYEATMPNEGNEERSGEHV